MVIALSWSRISDARQCLRKFDLKYNQKAPNFKEDSSKNVHLIRGGNVHKYLENYVIKKRAGEVGIPPTSMNEVETTKPLIDSLMSAYDIHPELQVAINDKFEQVDWFASDAWFRVIFDIIGFGENLFIGDYKTGKFTDYTGSMREPGQLHMSSLIGMAIWPRFEDVDNRYIYVDHKKTIPLKLKRSQHFEELKNALVTEHARINEEKNFDPKKNQFCNFCMATPDQCEFSKKVAFPR